MQLDSCRIRRSEKYQHQIQKSRETVDRHRNTQRFERMMNSRLNSIDEALRSIESRISAEVEQRVATAVQDILENSDLIRNAIAKATSSSSSSDSDSAESESSITTSSCASITTGDEVEDPEASCSVQIVIPSTPHYPNKWEFIDTLQPGQVTDFRLEQFTDPVRASLKLTSEQEIFPRMSLEEMIERDHPTTSDSSLFDEKKITCRNRPHGKELTDEEFFCLAPCCSDMRLFQAASCPFLPAFVRNRLNKSDDCKVIVQRTTNGIELITPIKWQLVKPIVPDRAEDVVAEEEVHEEEEEEEEDPFVNRDVVEQLMHEYFIPTPSLPLDEMVFGPYLQSLRESEVLPENLLHDLVRRVNSNLDNSYKSHHELELFAELDDVPIDEKYGRLPFNSMGN